MSTQFVTSTDGIKLNVTTWGNPSNTPIVLVHGYPDNHSVWLPVISELEREFYLIAYDVRGHGKSDVPKSVKGYKLEQLAKDLKAVTDELVPDRKFHLVGHDWGSVQSWESVTTKLLEGRIASYTTLSGPSLDHVSLWIKKSVASFSLQQIRKVFTQLFATWYIFLFQLPYLPEWLWKNKTYPNFHKFLEKTQGVPRTTESPSFYQDGLNGISLYRANFFTTSLWPKPNLYAHSPVQLVVLTKDTFIKPVVFEDLNTWVKQLYKRELDEKHWAILTKPKVVAGYIEEFVNKVEWNKLEDLEEIRVK